MNEERPKYGSLWAKTDKNGKPYLSGSLTLPGRDKVSIVAFQTKKNKENSPDWVIFESTAKAITPLATQLGQDQLPLIEEEKHHHLDDDDNIPF